MFIVNPDYPECLNTDGIHHMHVSENMVYFYDRNNERITGWSLESHSKAITIFKQIVVELKGKEFYNV